MNKHFCAKLYVYSHVCSPIFRQTSILSADPFEMIDVFSSPKSQASGPCFSRLGQSCSANALTVKSWLLLFMFTLYAKKKKQSPQKNPQSHIFWEIYPHEKKKHSQ